MKASNVPKSDLDHDGSTTHSIELQNSYSESDKSSSQTSELQNSDLENNQSASTETVATSKPRSSKRWWWLLMALVVVGGGVAGWRLLSVGREEPAANESQSQAVRVRISPVETATVVESEEYIANLDSRRSVTLQPQIEGQVSRIFARAGQQVTAATPIIQVNPEEQQAAVGGVRAAAEAARAEVENARQTLRALQAERLSNQSQLELSQQQYQRYSRLAASGAVARDTAEQYENSFQAARSALGAINQRIQAQQAAVAQAEKELLQAQADVRGQQAQLGYFTISAPFAGTVGDIPVKVGDFVDTSTQLTTITQNQPLEVEISVPIERAPQLRPGMPVELLDVQGRSVGVSRVFFIAPNTANNTQSVLIKSLFDNSNNQLRADQYVRARVIWNQRPGVLIPTTAVSRIGGETFVFVAETQQPSQQEQSEQEQSQPAQSQLVAKQKTVKLGNIQGNNYQVIEGLQQGERLIVSGLLSLRDGATIMPESSQNSKAQSQGGNNEE